MTDAQKRDALAEFKRKAAEETAKRLAEIVKDPNSDPAHVVVAAKEILNRGWGPAPTEK